MKLTPFYINPESNMFITPFTFLTFMIYNSFGIDWKYSEYPRLRKLRKILIYF